MKKMHWSLEQNPPTFDILSAFVIARTAGVEHVTFTYGKGLHALKYSTDEVWRRVHRMAIPLAELCGLTWDMRPGKEISPWRGSYAQVEEIYLQTGSLFKLTGNKPCFSGYVTMTPRNIGYQAHRNSSTDWPRIKDYIEKTGKRVIVVPDDISVSERLNLYLGADMNMGPTTGPMALCHFSDAPYLTFRMLTEGDTRMEKFFNSGPFKVGSQFSFRGERQEFIWESDDFDTVIQHYTRLMSHAGNEQEYHHELLNHLRPENVQHASI